MLLCYAICGEKSVVNYIFKEHCYKFKEQNPYDVAAHNAKSIQAYNEDPIYQKFKYVICDKLIKTGILNHFFNAIFQQRQRSRGLYNMDYIYI